MKNEPVIRAAVCGGGAVAQARDIPQLVDQEHFGPDVPGELAAACGLLNGFPYSGRENTVSYLNTYDTETGEVRTLARSDAGEGYASRVYTVPVGGGAGERKKLPGLSYGGIPGGIGGELPCGGGAGRETSGSSWRAGSV